uniref:Geranylgeranyl transferase type-2 subunit alpha n=1 Tax=Lygus hesperus TaxID=30085 RepID=A0A0A9XHW1_LYGHE
MHGQVKTDKSAAVREKEKKQKDAKLKVYREGMTQIFERRRSGMKDWETMRFVGDVLSTNPDVYTLWNIRKEVLLQMIDDKSIDEPVKVGEGELRLTEICLKVNPKSYGAWHHRCWILEHFPELDLKRELALCNKYLKLDARNFHCWDYRRFITSKLGLSPEEELSYTMQKIEEDFSNYSSWHYRSKLLPLIHSDPAGIRPIKEEIHLRELDLVQNAAFTDPNDQSAWFYLRWLLGRLEPKLEIVMSFVCKEQSKMYIVFNTDASPSDSSIDVVSEHSGKWTTVNSLRDSSLWVSDLKTNSTEYNIKVTISNETENVSLKADAGFVWFRKPQFDPDVSPKLKALLVEQLETCNQLLELEPESKWPLLTSVVFMKAIDTNQYREEIIERLRSLMKYDKYRSSYYADTLSKFLIEEEFKSNELPTGSFSLKNLGLTSLYYTQYLARAERLDLSHNNLQRSLTKLQFAVNCSTLILDDNDLTSLQNIPSLPQLISLSVANNRLQTAEEILKCIDKLPSLQKINVAGNPFVEDDAAKQEFEKELKSLRPTLEITVD